MEEKVEFEVRNRSKSREKSRSKSIDNMCDMFDISINIVFFCVVIFIFLLFDIFSSFIEWEVFTEESFIDCFDFVVFFIENDSIVVFIKLINFLDWFGVIFF